ncbi:MAG: hypothetical protein HQK72_02005 [Desulfamplus sp.]|nr:hypothetical protein [Desulfamplus sp.]
MNNDPIVEEIRKIRQRHSEKFNFDLRLIFEDLKSRQNEMRTKIVSFSPKPYIKMQHSLSYQPHGHL